MLLFDGRHIVNTNATDPRHRVMAVWMNGAWHDPFGGVLTDALRALFDAIRARDSAEA